MNTQRCRSRPARISARVTVATTRSSSSTTSTSSGGGPCPHSPHVPTMPYGQRRAPGGGPRPAGRRRPAPAGPSPPARGRQRPADHPGAACSRRSRTSPRRHAARVDQRHRRAPYRRQARPDDPAARRHGRAADARAHRPRLRLRGRRRDARLRARHPRRDAGRRGPAARRAAGPTSPAACCSCSSPARRATTAPATCSTKACSTCRPSPTARLSPVTGASAIHITSALPDRLGQHRGRGRSWPRRTRCAIRVKGARRPRLRAAPHARPVPIACEIVQAMQTMVTRRIDVFDPTVVTVASIHAGTTNNVIPRPPTSSARSAPSASRTRRAVHDGIRRVAEGIAAAHEVGRRRDRASATRSRSTTTTSPRSRASVATDVIGDDHGSSCPTR